MGASVVVWVHKWLYGCISGCMGEICLGNKLLSFEHAVPDAVFRTCHSAEDMLRFFFGITVFESLSTFQLTALLLKSFHLLLHCYTLVCVTHYMCDTSYITCHTYNESHILICHTYNEIYQSLQTSCLVWVRLRTRDVSDMYMCICTHTHLRIPSHVPRMNQGQLSDSECWIAVCICIYVHIYTLQLSIQNAELQSIYVYIYKYICTHIHTATQHSECWIAVCICVYIHVYSLQLSILSHIPRTYMYMCTYTHIPVYVYIYTYTYRHVYVYMYTYTYPAYESKSTVRLVKSGSRHDSLYARYTRLKSTSHLSGFRVSLESWRVKCVTTNLGHTRDVTRYMCDIHV